MSKLRPEVHIAYPDGDKRALCEQITGTEWWHEGTEFVSITSPYDPALLRVTCCTCLALEHRQSKDRFTR